MKPSEGRLGGAWVGHTSSKPGAVWRPRPLDTLEKGGCGVHPVDVHRYKGRMRNCLAWVTQI